MCKICASCKGIMNYDPYFEAEVCGKCGKIERKPKEEIPRIVSNQSQSIDVLKKIMGTMIAHL